MKVEPLQNRGTMAPTPSGFVLALTVDAAGSARLLAAYGAHLRTFDTPAALLDASRSTDVELVIVPWHDRDRRSLVATVAAIRASRHSPPVRIYLERSAECLHALVSLSRAGASGVIVRDIDDDALSLRRVLERSLTRAEEVVSLAVQRVVHERHQPLVLLCLEHVADPLSATEVARRLRVSRRTLSTWARRAGAKGMRSLASKCRVLVALEVMRDSRRSLEQVAHELQFASSAHLHNTIRRYTGCAPREAVALDTNEWCRRLLAAPGERLASPPRLPGKAGVLPWNGPFTLTTQDSPHSTGHVPGEPMQ